METSWRMRSLRVASWAGVMRQERWIPCQISFREEMAVRSWPVSLQKDAKAMACEAPWKVELICSNENFCSRISSARAEGESLSSPLGLHDATFSKDALRAEQEYVLHIKKDDKKVFTGTQPAPFVSSVFFACPEQELKYEILKLFIINRNICK